MYDTLLKTIEDHKPDTVVLNMHLGFQKLMRELVTKHPETAHRIGPCNSGGAGVNIDYNYVAKFLDELITERKQIKRLLGG